MPCLWIKHTGFKGQEKALESLYTIYTGYPQPAKPYIIGHQKTPIQESEENQRFQGTENTDPDDEAIGGWRR